MFDTTELAAVTIEEFRRGLEGLTAEEAAIRPAKAGGGEMNAIAWSVHHIAAHWWNVSRALAGEPLEYRGPSRDGTPPPYEEALALLDSAERGVGRLAEVTNERMCHSLPELRGEQVATLVARATLHTWFHIGEINAVRQLLGHPPIEFVGPAGGRLRWIPESGRE